MGLHKTATTFLQESFLPRLSDATFVHAPHTLGLTPGPIERFVFNLLFRNAATLDRGAYRAEIEAFVAQQARPVIVSSEALFGWPFENHVNFQSNTDALADVMPGAKIWLVIRRQDRWLESAYSQVLKQGLSTSPERFTNFRNSRFGRFNWNIYNGPNLDVRDLDWGAYVAAYRRRFGEHNVFVQPFEAFVDDADRFLAEFCGFAGVSPIPAQASERTNIAYSPASAFAARLVNAIPMDLKRALRERIDPRWHPAAVLNRTLDPLLARRRGLLPEPLKSAALSLHREANARLAEAIGVDLSEYGYC